MRADMPLSRMKSLLFSRRLRPEKSFHPKKFLTTMKKSGDKTIFFIQIARTEERQQQESDRLRIFHHSVSLAKKR
jgi:hypothetical protein